MWLSLELGICLKPHFRRHAGAHTYTEVHMSMQHSGFNAAALGPLIYFFTQASSPAFNSTCFYLERVAGPFKLIRKQQNQMNSIYFSLINCMAIWPGWKACTLDSLLQGPEAEPINRSPSLVGTCSLLTTVSVLSLPRLLLINMPDPYHFVLRQVWQPFRLVYLPTSSFVAVKHRKEWEDWLLGLTLPDANHVVLRTLSSLLGTLFSSIAWRKWQSKYMLWCGTYIVPKYDLLKLSFLREMYTFKTFSDFAEV